MESVDDASSSTSQLKCIETGLDGASSSMFIETILGSLKQHPGGASSSTSLLKIIETGLGSLKQHPDGDSSNKFIETILGSLKQHPDGASSSTSLLKIIETGLGSLKQHPDGARSSKFIETILGSLKQHPDGASSSTSLLEIIETGLGSLKQHPDGASSSTSLLKIIETGLGSLKQHPDGAIFRVPQNLRQVDPSAYEPMFFSIGPYHYTPALGRHEHVSRDIDVKERPKLQQGQELKWHFLRDFLRRNHNKVSLADYISLVQGSELEARKCYIEDVSLGSDEFNLVMLLDACFILELFTRVGSWNRNYHQHGNNMCLNWAYKDLLLLENQLPLFILDKIYNLFRTTDLMFPCSLHDLVLRKLKCLITNHFGVIKERLTRRAESEVGKISSKYHHLVHLVHAHLFHPPKPATVVNSNYHSKIDRSASTLRAMGVKIVRPTEEASLFEIKFADGILQLPHHHIFDSTGQVLRNFIAFEQTSEFVDHYFSPYAFFMDYLINTTRDVDTLEKFGVVTSHIGSNENVANLFNRIGIGCIGYKSKNYLSEIETRLEKYCQIRRHRWRAKLVDDYFGNPWAILSLLAAIALLVLTALQTIFTILY